MDILALARFLSAAINPVFVLLLIISPFLPKRKNDSLLFHFVRCVLSLVIAVPLAEMGKHYRVWAGHPWFPSGHMTFAVTCATCLILLDKRWAYAAVPLAALIGWALVAAHYHHSEDIAGAIILGATVTATTFSATRANRFGQAQGGG